MGAVSVAQPIPTFCRWQSSACRGPYHSVGSEQRRARDLADGSSVSSMKVFLIRTTCQTSLSGSPASLEPMRLLCGVCAGLGTVAGGNRGSRGPRPRPAFETLRSSLCPCANWQFSPRIKTFSQGVVSSGLTPVSLSGSQPESRAWSRTLREAR